MSYLQSFGKNNRFKKYNLEDFCQILTDQQNCLSDDFSAVSKRQLFNELSIFYHSQVEILSVSVVYLPFKKTEKCKIAAVKIRENVKARI